MSERSPVELEHRYGPAVHVHTNPYLQSLLARLSSPAASRSEVLANLRVLYTALAPVAFGREWPHVHHELPTRMAAHEPHAGVLRAELVDPSLHVVVCDVIRGGMVPAQVCFELASQAVPEENVRQDHLNLARVAAEDGRVTGADLTGSKVGGTVEGACLVLPDPMGATGATTLAAYRHYREHWGRPAQVLLLPLIATPEYLRAVLDGVDDARVHTLRVDRGLSPPDVLAGVPGERWEEERGLDRNAYIVPGAGGLGEVLNNAWV